MKKKILVVDDSAPVRELEVNILRLLGYEPVSAASGMEALKLLTRIKPDLALLDIHLPDMDGFKICQHIKAHPATAAIPVFMVSAKKTGEDMQRGEKAGADEFIAKPFDLEEITSLVKKYLDHQD